MRVAHIESGRHLYGGARQVLHLVDGLRGCGAENVLVCAAGSAISRAAAGLCDVVELPLRGDLDFTAARRLRRTLEAAAVRPDIVHVHSRRGADLYGGLASVGARWRAVLSRRVDHREWAPWARLKYRPYAAVVAISRAVERELVEHVGLPRERVHLIPSGVRSEATGFGFGSGAGSGSGTDAQPHGGQRRDGHQNAELARNGQPLADFVLDGHRHAKRRRAAHASLVSTFGFPPDALIAAVIGQLIPRKGHRVLLAALPGVLERHPRWHVVLFGRGPLEAELRRSIERRGLTERVRLAGFRSDLSQLLPGIDLVLHPAQQEGLGLAVLEAMSAGVPVAVSAVGGLVDVLEDGVSGLLLPPNDPRAWAGALVHLFADSCRRARFGDEGRRRVHAAFDVRRMVLAHIALYRALLGITAPASPASLARPAGARP